MKLFTWLFSDYGFSKTQMWLFIIIALATLYKGDIKGAMNYGVGAYGFYKWHQWEAKNREIES